MMIEYNGIFYNFYKIKGETIHEFYKRIYNYLQNNHDLSKCNAILYGCSY